MKHRQPLHKGLAKVKCWPQNIFHCFYALFYYFLVYTLSSQDSTMSNRACTFSASLAGPANEMGSFSKVPRTHVFSLVSKFEKITSDGVTAENVEVSAGNFTNLLSPKHVNIATSYCKSAPAMGGKVTLMLLLFIILFSR